jgi:hypothetical protein
MIGISSTNPATTVTGDYPLFPCGVVQDGAGVTVECDARWTVREDGRFYAYLMDNGEPVYWSELHAIGARAGDTIEVRRMTMRYCPR